MREDIDRDYERKYSSLRKEKEKDKLRKEPRDYRRDDYYYGRRYVAEPSWNFLVSLFIRYQDEYDDERSRPSSRSDLYRERHDKERRDRRDRERDREKDRYRRRRGDPREVYNPYQVLKSFDIVLHNATRFVFQGYAYDPYNPYYQQYQYYENLRRTNPQAYAEWYHKYYQTYGGEDRASVHSGRSSANDELAKDR